MKDPFVVLLAKEQELLRVQREIEALRIVAELLDEESPNEIRQPIKKVAEMP